MSTALQQAHAAFNAHSPTMDKATAAYRARLIGDDAFLTVRAEHQRLLAAIDDAEGSTARAVERNRQIDQEAANPVSRTGTGTRGLAFGGPSISEDDERHTEAACFPPCEP